MDGIRIEILSDGPLLSGESVAQVENILERYLGMAALHLEGEIRQRTPAGVTGNLRGRTQHEIQRDGTDIRALIFNDLEYAEVLESGGRPHWIGSHTAAGDGLRLWILRVLGLGGAEGERAHYFLRRMIAREGTSSRGGRQGPTGGTGYWMFDDAWTANEERINALLNGPMMDDLRAVLE